MNRVYYKVTGGKALKAVERLKRYHKRSVQERIDLAHEIGAVGLYASRHRVDGFTFNEPPGKGWLPIRHFPDQHNIYKPDGRTKTGRGIKKRMEALPTIPGGRSFARLLGVKVVLEGNSIHFSTFEQIGSNLVLSVPIPDGEVPPDIDGTKQIQTSEYWQTKEAGGAS